MQNISGFGLKVQVRASVTFPAGFSVTQFADDADPLDTPSIQINDKAMGLNGDLLMWSKANPLVATLNVVPGGEDDRNLATLFEANRTGRGKQSSRDIVTMVISYPDGTRTTLTLGGCTDFVPSNGVASAGRLKTKPYAFAFENKVDS